MKSNEQFIADIFEKETKAIKRKRALKNRAITMLSTAFVCFLIVISVYPGFMLSSNKSDSLESNMMCDINGESDYEDEELKTSENASEPDYDNYFSTDVDNNSSTADKTYGDGDKTVEESDNNSNVEQTKKQENKYIIPVVIFVSAVVIGILLYIVYVVKKK